MSLIPLGILASAAVAPGAASSFDWLETTTLSTTTNSVLFSNLNTYSNYKHLQFRLMASTATSNLNNNNMTMLVNEDTTSTYSRHFLNGETTTVSSGGVSSSTQIDLADVLPGSQVTLTFGAIILDLLDFSSSNKHKLFRIFAGSVGSAERDLTLQGGLWRNTAAVTSVRFTGNFATNSRFSLYGIKG